MSRRQAPAGIGLSYLATPAAAVPEPGSAALLGGVLVLGAGGPATGKAGPLRTRGLKPLALLAGADQCFAAPSTLPRPLLHPVQQMQD